MSKVTRLDSQHVAKVAAAFSKPLDFSEAMMIKYGVTVDAISRQGPGDLNGFYSTMSAVLCQDETLAQQQFKDESDPNVIMAQFARNGQIDPSHLELRNGVFGDATQTPESYHAAMNLLVDAQDAFMTLNAKIRARFDNDPSKLMAFLSDDRNFEEACTLGILSRVETPSEPVLAVSDTKGTSPAKPGEAKPTT